MALGRVLVVDDDRDVRQALAETLVDEGFEVVEAENGRDALNVARRTADLDVILLDIMMPEMDGWRFLSARLSDPSLCEIPVVAISAHPHAGQDAAKTGVVAFVPKPVSISDLVEKVRWACNEHRTP